MRPPYHPKDTYGIVAQVLHWTIAAAVFVQIALGLYSAGLPVSMARLQWLSRHKSLGIAILALALFRLVWRMLNRAPALPQSMPGWERHAALINHALLYALLVVVPLSGWLHASAAGLSVNWFGLFLVPDLIPQEKTAAEFWRATHRTCVFLLALLLALHIGAALRHALVLRDGIVYRMLPWKPRKTT